LRLLGAAFLIASAPSARDVKEIRTGLQTTNTSMDSYYHNLSSNNSLPLHVLEPPIGRDENQQVASGLAKSSKALDNTACRSNCAKSWN
jgi:hypothetical protein